MHVLQSNLPYAKLAWFVRVCLYRYSRGGAVGFWCFFRFYSFPDRLCPTVHCGDRTVQRVTLKTLNSKKWVRVAYFWTSVDVIGIWWYNYCPNCFSNSNHSWRGYLFYRNPRVLPAEFNATPMITWGWAIFNRILTRELPRRVVTFPIEINAQ